MVCFVACSATGLATVAIQASDLLQGTRGNLLSSAIESGSPCRAGAVPHNFGDGTLCVDAFEASPGSDCPLQAVENQLATQQNVDEPACSAVSQAGQTPWRYVSLTQAQQLCARSGARLPTPEEWYQVAVQLQDQSGCVLTDTSARPTDAARCATVSGVHDIVGNVWEWVDGEVVNGTYNARSVPGTGYVASVDSDGMVVSTKDVPSAAHGADYAITDDQGVHGIIRGGYYDSGTDGGLFAQNIAVPLDLQTNGIGFRCVESVR